MSAYRLAAGKTADGLVHDCLTDGSRQILLGRAVIDERLNIGFGKYTAARGDRIERLIALGIFI